MNEFSTLTSRHPGEDELELYCLDRLDEPQAAPIEEHLLVCEACRQRVTDLDVFLKAAMQATRELRSEERYSGAGTSWTWLFRPGWIAAGALAVLALAVVPVMRRPALQEISVSAYRGAGEQTGAGVAQAARPLRLHLDLTGIPAEGCCIVEIVSSDGKVLREVTATITDNRASLDQPDGLTRGQYWLRLKSASGADLREYGLTVR